MGSACDVGSNARTDLALRDRRRRCRCLAARKRGNRLTNQDLQPLYPYQVAAAAPIVPSFALPDRQRPATA